MSTPRKEPAPHEPLTLEVDDPRALRAMAHPARQRLIAELLAGRVMTATEAADLVGLSPSAVSHHLRALERYGIAERAEPGEDARTRPWRSRVTDLNFTPRDVSSAEAVNVVVQQELARLSRNLDGLLRDRREGPRKHDSIGLSVSETWLTDTERQETLARIEELLDGLPRRHSANRPEGSVRMSLVISLVPVHDDAPAPGPRSSA